MLKCIIEMVTLKPKTLKMAVVVVLILFGLLSRFFFIWLPAEVVFDEVHYGKYVNGYLKGENFFSGHPPLGIQLVALGGWLGGYNAHFKFDQIGEKFNDNSFIALRFMPNLAGALIPAVVAWFSLVLGFSVTAAFFTGLLLILENALLVQSHFIFLDAFLILFGFAGLGFFFSSRQRNYSSSFLMPAGLFFGLSSAVKWTGLGFLLLACLTAAVDFLKGSYQVRLKESAREITNEIGKLRQFSFSSGLRLVRPKLYYLAKLTFGLLIVPFIVYFLTIALHFYLLPNQGPGDAFFSKDFLAGKKNLAAKFIEFNIK